MAQFSGQSCAHGFNSARISLLVPMSIAAPTCAKKRVGRPPRCRTRGLSIFWRVTRRSWCTRTPAAYCICYPRESGAAMSPIRIRWCSWAGTRARAAYWPSWNRRSPSIRRPGTSFEELRPLPPLLPAEEAGLLAYARATHHLAQESTLLRSLWFRARSGARRPRDSLHKRS